MKVKFLTPTIQQPNFTGKSQKFRTEYSQRLETNNISNTNIRNLKGLTERFANEGLSYSQCLKAAKLNPFMLVQKPETMEYNIRETARRFASHGITTESYLQSALRNPPIFSISPKKIENNMRGHARALTFDGLSVAELFKIAQVHPAIYTMQPQTLNKRVSQMAQGMGVERHEIIEVLKKHPTIASLDTNNLVKKFKFLKYIEKNKFFDAGKPIPSDAELKPVVLRKSLTNSMELDYLILLRNKISSTIPRGSKLPFDYLKEAIVNFIRQNNEKTIELKMPADSSLKEFTRFARNLSRSTVGRNIFKFKVV